MVHLKAHLHLTLKGGLYKCEDAFYIAVDGSLGNTIMSASFESKI